MLAPGGLFVLADLDAVGYLRAFYTLARRRGRMHTRRELTGMLAAAHLDVQSWAPVFDLDPLLPLRRRPPRRPTGRVPLVTAVIAAPLEHNREPRALPPFWAGRRSVTPGYLPSLMDRSARLWSGPFRRSSERRTVTAELARLVGAENACHLGVCAEEAIGSVPARGGW